jgi:hypothetical protein
LIQFESPFVDNVVEEGTGSKGTGGWSGRVGDASLAGILGYWARAALAAISVRVRLHRAIVLTFMPFSPSSGSRIVVRYRAPSFLIGRKECRSLLECRKNRSCGLMKLGKLEKLAIFFTDRVFLRGFCNSIG